MSQQQQQQQQGRACMWGATGDYMCGVGGAAAAAASEEHAQAHETREPFFAMAYGKGVKLYERCGAGKESGWSLTLTANPDGTPRDSTREELLRMVDASGRRYRDKSLSFVDQPEQRMPVVVFSHGNLDKPTAANPLYGTQYINVGPECIDGKVNVRENVSSIRVYPPFTCGRCARDPAFARANKQLCAECKESRTTQRDLAQEAAELRTRAVQPPAAAAAPKTQTQTQPVDAMAMYLATVKPQTK